MVVDTKSDGSGTTLANSTLVRSHTYTVLSADANGLTLYNPWGVDTDWRLLDSNHDGYFSTAEHRASPDGRDGNFDDGLVRISSAAFTSQFTAYTIGAVTN